MLLFFHLRNDNIFFTFASLAQTCNIFLSNILRQITTSMQIVFICYFLASLALTKVYVFAVVVPFYFVNNAI